MFSYFRVQALIFVLCVAMLSCGKSVEDAATTQQTSAAAVTAQSGISALTQSGFYWTMEETNPNNFNTSLYSRVKVALSFDANGTGEVTYWAVNVGQSAFVQVQVLFPYTWTLSSNGSELTTVVQNPNNPPTVTNMQVTFNQNASGKIVSFSYTDQGILYTLMIETPPFQ